MKYINFLFESIYLLLENQKKIDFVKTQNPNISTAHDTLAQYHDSSSIIDHFANLADPTESKDYLQWIVGRYKKQDFRQEDHPRIRTALNTFHRNKPALEKKDINQYKQLSDVEDAVQPFGGGNDFVSNKKTKRNVKDEGADLLLNKNGVMVHHIKTEDAACHYGRDTRWCTAADENNMFEHYNKSGPIYVIHTPDKRKYQFHFQSNQFMDEKDQPIEPHELFEKHPELYDVKEFHGDHVPASFPTYDYNKLGNAEYMARHRDFTKEDHDDFFADPDHQLHTVFSKHLTKEEHEKLVSNIESSNVPWSKIQLLKNLLKLSKKKNDQQTQDRLFAAPLGAFSTAGITSYFIDHGTNQTHHNLLDQGVVRGNNIINMRYLIEKSSPDVHNKILDQTIGMESDIFKHTDNDTQDRILGEHGRALDHLHMAKYGHEGIVSKLPSESVIGNFSAISQNSRIKRKTKEAYATQIHNDVSNYEKLHQYQFTSLLKHSTPEQSINFYNKKMYKEIGTSLPEHLKAFKQMGLTSVSDIRSKLHEDAATRLSVKLLSVPEKQHDLSHKDIINDLYDTHDDPVDRDYHLRQIIRNIHYEGDNDSSQLILSHFNTLSKRKDFGEAAAFLRDNKEIRFNTRHAIWDEAIKSDHPKNVLAALRYCHPGSEREDSVLRRFPEHSEILAEIAKNTARDDLFDKLSVHPDPEVRKGAIENRHMMHKDTGADWTGEDEPTERIKRMAKDKDSEVRKHLGNNNKLSHSLLANDPDYEVRDIANYRGF